MIKVLVLALLFVVTEAQNPVDICGAAPSSWGTQTFESIVQVRAIDGDGKIAWNWVSLQDYTIRVSIVDGASKANFKAFYLKSVTLAVVDTDNFAGVFSGLPANTALIQGCKNDGNDNHPIFGSTADAEWTGFDVAWQAPEFDESQDDIGNIFFYFVVQFQDNTYAEYVTMLVGHDGEIIANPVCGNGAAEFPEQCEIGEVRLCGTLNSGWNSGQALCFTDADPAEVQCRWDTSPCFFRYCGDGHLNSRLFETGLSNDAAEDCDLTADRTADGFLQEGEFDCTGIVQLFGGGDNLQTFVNPEGWEGGTYTCGDDCRWNIDNCFACGDGFVSGPEECEDDDSMSCEDWDTQFAGGANGYNQGVATCSGTCVFDTSGCSVASTAFCGDGVVNLEEECDTGGDLTQVLEACDRYNRDFDFGDVYCTAECTYDVTGCSDCGDGKAELDKNEECEYGEQLRCLTWDLDFGPGTGFLDSGYAYCNVFGCTWNSGTCFHTYCGDGNDDPEDGECDFNSPNTATVTCADLPNTFWPGGASGAPFTSGSATCTNQCTFDLSGCVAEACGDGNVNQINEQCDGAESRPGTFDCAALDDATYGRFHSGTALCTDSCQIDTTPCITCEDIYADCLDVAMQDCGADEDDCMCFNRAMKCASDQGCCNEVQDVCRAAFATEYPNGDPYPQMNSLGESYGIQGNSDGRTCSADLACHCGLVGEYGICPVVLIECPTSWVQQNCVARDRNDMCRAPNCPGISEQMMIEQFNCRYAYDYDGDNSPDTNFRAQRYPDGTLGESWNGYPFGAHQTGQNAP